MGYVLVTYNYISHKVDLVRKSNILIDSNGHACLAGFSPLMIIPDELIAVSPDSPGCTTQWVGGMRWSAPEVLKGGAPSKQTDIYSFAMVMIEARHR